jgi:shikimate kinase
MNIVLIGFMATGKSTLGKALAKRLNWEYLDTDKLIEQKAGCSIPRIFAEKGESYFRQLEASVAKELASAEKKVIATGGGFPLNPENIHQLRPSSLIVCLTAAPEVIYQRAARDTNRPLLQVEDPLAKIKQLLAERASCYANADLAIDTSLWDPEVLIADILAEMKRRGLRIDGDC